MENTEDFSIAKKSMVARQKLILFLGTFLFVLSPGFIFNATPACASQALKKAAKSCFPVFVDDSSAETLSNAIRNSLDYLDRISPSRKFDFGGDIYSAAWMKDSLRLFLSLLQKARTPAELDRLVQNNFEIYQISDATGKSEVLVTGYYEPVFRGSAIKRPPFLYPLYKTPADLVNAPGEDGEMQVGRFQNGLLVPYWSREEIEKEGMLAGNELVYLADQIDAFILHVQGSGRIVFPDGHTRGINYDAGNGRPYSSIGRYLVERGDLQQDEVSLPAIRCYLENNANDCQKILNMNQSYIFFSWADQDQEGPRGSLGRPLTPLRSVALDQDYFPPGALAFLQTRKPVINDRGDIISWRPMSVFVLNQDSGSAIKGPGRVDLFWGRGEYAETAAGHMKHQGNLFFLVKKRES